MNWVICYLGIKQLEGHDYFTQSLNHEMYLQLVKNSTLSQFVDKRC